MAAFSVFFMPDRHGGPFRRLLRRLDRAWSDAIVLLPLRALLGQRGDVRMIIGSFSGGPRQPPIRDRKRPDECQPCRPGSVSRAAKLGSSAIASRDILRTMWLAVTDVTNSRREMLIVLRLSLSERPQSGHGRSGCRPKPELGTEHITAAMQVPGGSPWDGLDHQPSPASTAAAAPPVPALPSRWRAAWRCDPPATLRTCRSSWSCA
jgi:hypothetical protein